MTVEGTGSVGSGGGVAPVSDMPAGLSYEGIILTLKRRLSDLNSQINGVREEIEHRSQMAKELTNHIQALKDAKTKAGSGETDGIHVDDLTAEQRQLLENSGLEIPEDLPTKSEYEAALATIEEFEADGDISHTERSEAVMVRDQYETGIVSEEEIDNAISQLNTELQHINSDNETLMIQMQEAVSQRQVQIQLATNSMRSLSDTAKSVVGNIGG